MSAPSDTATEPVRPIKTDADLDAALQDIERLWGAKRGTPDGDRLDVLATLVHEYESKRWPIELPDPVSAIVFALEQRGLTPDALVPMIGSKEHVDEVLSRKRALTLAMIRRLRDGLGISADVLVGPRTQV